MSSGSLQDLLAIELLIDADATGGLNYITTRAFTTTDAVLVPTAAVGAATARLSNVAVFLSDVLACAVIGLPARPTTWTLAARDFTASGRLRLTTSAAAARCVCTVYVVPPVDVVIPLT